METGLGPWAPILRVLKVTTISFKFRVLVSTTASQCKCRDVEADFGSEVLQVLCFQNIPNLSLVTHVSTKPRTSDLPRP